MSTILVLERNCGPASGTLRCDGRRWSSLSYWVAAGMERDGPQLDGCIRAAGRNASLRELAADWGVHRSDAWDVDEASQLPPVAWDEAPID